ncbi:helix-turn-helix domain-containing protein [Streptosporangium sp. G12]
MAEKVPRRGENAVLLALASGVSIADAARAGGVSPRTVNRWLDNHAFTTQVAELRAQLLGRTVGALIEASVEAVATLRCSLHADSEAVRVRAATAILSAVITIRESVDLEERLAALETAEKEGPYR